MSITLKLEELVMFILSVFLFSFLPFSWWWFPVLLLTPDIGMLGYLAGPKWGARTYYLFHHKGLAILIMGVGWYLQIPWIILMGIILFGHASMDRIFGYGLKFSDSFHHTHLGWISKPQSR